MHTGGRLVGWWDIVDRFMCQGDGVQ